MLNKNKSRAAILGVLALGVTTSQAFAATSTTGLNATQKAEVQQLVKQTLVQDPEIILQAVEALKAKQQKVVTAEATQQVQQVAKQLVADPSSPSIGPEDAPVVVIEFFDYQCAYCHKMFPTISGLVKTNPNVKFIFKELPFFGEASTYAAKVSLIASKQGKFEAFHNALFASKLMEGQLTDQAVNNIAKQVGVDISNGVDQEWIDTEIANTKNLANQLKFSGTPAFIIMSNNLHPDINKISYIPGAVPENVLDQAIQKAQ